MLLDGVGTSDVVNLVERSREFVDVDPPGREHDAADLQPAGSPAAVREWMEIPGRTTSIAASRTAARTITMQHWRAPS